MSYNLLHYSSLYHILDKYETSFKVASLPLKVLRTWIPYSVGEGGREGEGRGGRRVEKRFDTHLHTQISKGFTLTFRTDLITSTYMYNNIHDHVYHIRDDTVTCS